LATSLSSSLISYLIDSFSAAGAYSISFSAATSSSSFSSATFSTSASATTGVSWTGVSWTGVSTAACFSSTGNSSGASFYNSAIASYLASYFNYLTIGAYYYSSSTIAYSASSTISASYFYSDPAGACSASA